MEFLIAMSAVCWVIFGGLLFYASDKKDVTIQAAIIIVGIEIAVSFVLAASIIAYAIGKH